MYQLILNLCKALNHLDNLILIRVGVVEILGGPVAFYVVFSALLGREIGLNHFDLFADLHAIAINIVCNALITATTESLVKKVSIEGHFQR